VVGDTVGRGRHNGSVWNSGDGTQRLGRLEVSQGLTTRGVDPGGSHVIAITDLKRAVLGVVRSIVCTSETVIYVLAVCAWGFTTRITDLDAEGVATHEVCPVVYLVVGVVVATTVGERVRVHESTDGVTTKVSTVRVELSSIVTGSKVDLGLIDKTSNLNIVWSLDDLHALESTLGNETGAVAGLGTPGNFLAFSVADCRVWLGGSPEAEIVYVVDEGRLTHGFLVLSRGVADVVADLRSADGRSDRIDLIGDSTRVGIVFAVKRDRVVGIGLSEYDGGNGEGQ